MNKLPNELFIYILEFLDTKSYVSFLQTGCVIPYNVAQNERKKKEHIIFSYWKNIFSKTELNEVGCCNCGSNKIITTLVRSRSSDEAPSTIYKCSSCNNKWKKF